MKEGPPGTKTHQRWLGSQRFQFEPTELAFIDLLAAVDGLPARRLLLDERLWPTVSRLRAFRGVDTLTTLSVHHELGGDRRRAKAAGTRDCSMSSSKQPRSFLDSARRRRSQRHGDNQTPASSD